MAVLLLPRCIICNGQKVQAKVIPGNIQSAGFHGLAVVAWIYGIALGLFLYTSKMFCYSVVSN